MIPLYLRARGVSRAFPKEFEVDLSGLEPGIYAIAGENAAGKTTLMELLAPATLYRDFPSYGELLIDKVANDRRDAVVELTFQLAGGDRARATLLLDGKTRKAEAYWYAHDPAAAGGGLVPGGWVAVAGPNLASFDAERDRHLPSLRILLASSFKCQRVTRATGSFLTAKVSERRLLLRELLMLDELQQEHERLKKLAADRKLEAEQLWRTHVELREQRERRQDLLDAQVAVAEQIQQSSARVGFQRLKLKEAEEVFGSVAAGRAAHAAQMLGYNEQRIRHDREARAASGELDQAEVALAAIDAPAPAEPRLEDLRQLRELAAEAETNERKLGLERQDLEAEERRVAEGHARRLALEEQQADAVQQAEGLSRLEDPTQPMCQRCPMVSDAQEARKRGDRLRGEAYKLPTSGAAIAAKGFAIEAEDFHLQAQHMLVTIRKRLADCEELHRNLAKAVGAREELKRGRRGVVERLAAIRRRLVELEATAPVPPPPLAVNESHEAALDRERQLMRTAEEAHEALVKTGARIEGALEQFDGDIDSKLANVEHLAELAQRDTAAAELAARGLGPTGAQVLAVEDAGPELEALTNEFLGLIPSDEPMRFELPTTRRDADNKRDIEDLTPKLFVGDHELTAGCGGETVIFDEAIALAFSLYHARRSGKRMLSLFRDETAGALSPRNAQAYLEMLRHARDRGGFERVFFIAHNPELVAGADGVLWVAGGKVEIR